MSHNVTTDTKKKLITLKGICTKLYKYLKNISPCSFFFFVLFSVFTSKLKAGMDCQTCFTVNLKSTGIYHSDIEYISKAAMFVRIDVFHP